MEKWTSIQSRSLKLFDSYDCRELLVKEVSRLEQGIDDDSEYFISILLSESSRSKTAPQQYVTQFVIELLSYMIQSTSDSERECLLRNGSTLVAKLRKSNIIKNPEVQAKLNLFPNLVPLDVLYEFDKIGAISFIEYLQASLEDEKKVTTLINQLVHLCCNNKQKTVRFQIMMYMVHIAHGSVGEELQKVISGQTVKMSMKILNSVIRKIWDHLWENVNSNVYLFNLNRFPDCALPPNFDRSSLRRFSVEQLAFLLSYKPEIKATVAISSQSDWTYFKSPSSVVQFITEILLAMELEVAVDKINEVLSRYEINWKTLLNIISAIYVVHSSGSMLLKGLVTNLLHRAMEKLQTDLLLAAFLVTRQIAFESVLTNYGFWFSNISATSSKHFAFLTKFLTSIVRYEPVAILKAHLSNPLNVPNVDNCRDLWNDYATLVRTRLVDLGPRNQESMAELDSSVENEVQNAVAAFERSGRVPNSVLEVAIFRKPYFVQKFLPALLKPRIVPNPPDAKQYLIQELKKAGKLPAALYEAYLASCDLLSEQHSDPCDVEMQAEQDDPLARLAQQLQQLRALQSGQVAEHFFQAFAALPRPSDQQLPEIQMEDFSSDQFHDQLACQIIGHWIDSLNQVLLFEEKSGDWCNQYFLVLCPHARLISALYYQTWSYVTIKCTGDCDIDEKARCYGKIIYLLCQNSRLLSPVRCANRAANYAEILVAQLNLKRADSMLFLLPLLRCVLLEDDCLQSEAAQKMAQLYKWIARRVEYSGKYKQRHGQQRVAGICQGSNFSARISKMQLKDWLELEMQVDALHDVLHWCERSRYLHAVFHEDYAANGQHDDVVCDFFDCLIRNMVARPTSSPANCLQDLLMLLQSQLLHQAPTSSRSAWLTGCWLKLHQEIKDKNIDVVLWSVACALPPFLLCKNSINQTTMQDSIQLLSRLVGDYWRDSLTEKAWLPSYVTDHLVSALDVGVEVERFPCLLFSEQVHQVARNIWPNLSAPWQCLSKAVNIFNPASSGDAVRSLSWSGIGDVDTVASQLIGVAAAVWYVEHNSVQFPWYVGELGENITGNHHVLRAWNVSSWIGESRTLPWDRILPTYLFNIMAYVQVNVLISWSEKVHHHQAAKLAQYLEALVSAHTRWIQVTHSFVDLVSDPGTGNSIHEYPAGKLLDFITFGRLHMAVKRIISQSPVSALQLFHKSNSFRDIDADLKAAALSKLSLLH